MSQRLRLHYWCSSFSVQLAHTVLHKISLVCHVPKDIIVLQVLLCQQLVPEELMLLAQPQLVLTVQMIIIQNKENAFCSPVPPGMRINDAGNGLTVCPHKTYSDWGDKTCIVCPNRYLCPEKTQFYTGELSCPRGSYCVAGV